MHIRFPSGGAISKRQISFEYIECSARYIMLITNAGLAIVKVPAFWQQIIVLLEYFHTDTQCGNRMEYTFKKQTTNIWSKKKVNEKW